MSINNEFLFRLLLITKKNVVPTCGRERAVDVVSEFSSYLVRVACKKLKPCLRKDNFAMKDEAYWQARMERCFDRVD